MIDALITQLQSLYPTYDGFAPNGCTDKHYAVVRPMAAITADTPIAGASYDHSLTVGVYCRADGITASYNMGVATVNQLNGLVLAGSMLTADLSYTGALIDGQYESAVTVTYIRGGNL